MPKLSKKAETEEVKPKTKKESAPKKEESTKVEAQAAPAGEPALLKEARKVLTAFKLDDKVDQMKISKVEIPFLADLKKEGHIQSAIVDALHILFSGGSGEVAGETVNLPDHYVGQFLTKWLIAKKGSINQSLRVSVKAFEGGLNAIQLFEMPKE